MFIMMQEHPKPLTLREAKWFARLQSARYKVNGCQYVSVEQHGRMYCQRVDYLRQERRFRIW
jgi:hypothetical protein